MKSIAAHAQSCITSWDRQPLCYPRQIMVERGIETGDLDQGRVPGPEGLDQRDLPGQVFGAQRDAGLQFGQKIG